MAIAILIVVRRLIPFLLTVSVACGQTDLTITAEFPTNVSLSWRNLVAGDEALRRVFDVERRQTLVSGGWNKVASDNFTGTYTDSAPPDESGFYRLKESTFPFALSGPDSESTTQGVRIVSPSGADVIFLPPREQITRNSLQPTNALTVVVNGAYRATIFYASDREGSDFRFSLATGIPTELLVLSGGEVELLAFSDGSLRPATPQLETAVSAARAGVSAAVSEVTLLLSSFPDSATVWQNIGGSVTNEATVLYYRAKSNDPSVGASPAAFGANVAFFAKPLVSGAPAVPLGEIAEALPAAGSEMVNLNGTESARGSPWIGSRSSALNDHPTTAAKWVYISADGSETNATNPPVARYAYWIEDQTFRVNPALVPLGAVDTNGMTAAEIRFLVTTNSEGLDLSRGGFRRFNINSLTNAISSPVDANAMRLSLDRIVAVITNSNASPLFGQRFYRSGAYHAATAVANMVASSDAAIYLQKIAANILDYVDSDDQPTVINSDPHFSLRVGKPDRGIEALGGLSGLNSVAAVGVENLPQLQEYALHARVRSMRYSSTDADSFGFSSSDATLNPKPIAAAYEVWLDHYFEFWNPGTRDITVTDAFLKIWDQPAWEGGSGALGVNRSSSDIALPAITFPAGSTTVLTTAPASEASVRIGNPSFAILSRADKVVCLSNVPSSERKFYGLTTLLLDAAYQNWPYGPVRLNYDRMFALRISSESSAGLLIGNQKGILTSSRSLFVANSTNPFVLSISNNYLRDTLTSFSAGNNDFVRASVLGVGLVGQADGDARACNEQLRFISGTPWKNGTPFLNTITSTLPGESSFGYPNTNVVPTVSGLTANWIDVSSLEAGSEYAPLFVRNNAMQSIGELGHITDPARTGGSEYAYARGGGRTLRIGQSEVGMFRSTPTNATAWWYASSQTNVSRTWPSWRLADLFSVQTNLRKHGLVNPNGVLRDGGRAFGALFHDFVFASAGGGIGSVALEGKAIISNAVTSQMTSRLTRVVATGLPSGSLNIFWERGEVSELSLFNSGTNLVGSADMSGVLDRGREEVVRRTIEQITTRGSVFTAYVVAQALSGTNTTDTIRLKQTFRVQPQFAAASAFDDAFNASSPASVAARFAAPTNFSSEVISEELTSVEAP